MLLDTCAIGRPYLVKSIKAGAVALLSDVGLFPGRSLKVVNKFPFGGPLVVDLGGYLVAIARSATAEIEVTRQDARQILFAVR